MIHIADNIWFSRYLFLEQLNYQGSRSLSLYRLCLNSLHYTLVFRQHNSNLIQSGFVVCACYWRILTGSLRMSAKCGTLKGFGFKKARPIDDGKIGGGGNEIKKEDAVYQQFSFFFFFNIFHSMKENSSCVRFRSICLLQILPI